MEEVSRGARLAGLSLELAGQPGGEPADCQQASERASKPASQPASQQWRLMNASH